MAVDESKRREISQAELEHAIAQVCKSVGIEPALLTESQRYGITICLV